MIKPRTIHGSLEDRTKKELLALARRRGYTIKEIPISWYYHEESKIHAVRDAFQMIGDILTIRRNISRGIYDPED